MKGFYDAYKQTLRLWIRRRMTPISIEEAEEKKLFWARMYMGVSFAVFCYLTAKILGGNYNLPFREDLPKNVAAGVLYHKRDVPVRFITFRGFEKVEDFTYSSEEIKRLKESSPGSLPEITSNKHTEN